ARFLEARERAELRAKFAGVIDAVAIALERDLGGPQSRLRAASALGSIGSITLHQTPIARQRALEVLTEAAVGVASVDPAAATPRAAGVHLPTQPEPASRRAEILRAAIPLFARNGYHQVSLGQIAGEVGLG